MTPPQDEPELLAEAKRRAKRLLAQLEQQQAELSAAKALPLHEKLEAQVLTERAIQSAAAVVRELDASSSDQHAKVNQENDEQRREDRRRQ
jgi:hypothetical protein